MGTYKVTFLPLNKSVEVDDEKYPLADHGKPGSLLDIALAHDVALEHNCGGSCPSTTSPATVRTGAENPARTQQDEEDRLHTAQRLTPHHRPGCQAVVQAA